LLDIPESFARRWRANSSEPGSRAGVPSLGVPTSWAGAPSLGVPGRRAHAPTRGRRHLRVYPWQALPGSGNAALADTPSLRFTPIRPIRLQEIAGLVWNDRGSATASRDRIAKHGSAAAFRFA